MTRTRLRLCLLSEDLSLPIDEGIKKFVTSVSGPLAEMTDLLVLAAGDAGPLPASVQAASANRFLLGGTLGRTLRRFQPDIVVYVPVAAATRNSFVRCAILLVPCPIQTVLGRAFTIVNRAFSLPPAN